MSPSEMTTVELLEACALELVNCEAISAANADEQLELAAALRSRASRIREALARLEAQRGTPAGLAPARAALDALRAINAPDGPTPKEGL